MKIAIIGATGNVGSRLVDEALSRGHQVTAVARNASRLPPDEKLTSRVPMRRTPSSYHERSRDTML